MLNIEFEQLPYSLGATHDALLRLEGLMRDITSSNRLPAGLPPRSIVGPLAEQMQPAAWAVDQFLDAARRTQNSLTRYVARTFRVSLPPSLNTLLSSPGKWQRKVPKQVWVLLSDYWSSHGRGLKGYRDLAQHHAVVSSDAYINVQPGGAPTIHLLLPSSATEVALEKLSYEAPFVPVATYCRREFVELFRVAYTLVYLLLRYTGVTNQGTIQLLRRPMSFKRSSAFVSLPSDDLDEVVRATRELAKSWAEKEFGALQAEPLPAETA